NLTQLHLSYNQITQIPEAIANLTNLTQLHLSNNQITQIPEAIANLTNLTQLHLSDNQITQIPEALANLTNLTQLHLYNNQITQIPEAIESLPKLKTLDLRGNPLPISPEILGSSNNVGSVEDILNYSRLLRSGEVDKKIFITISGHKETRRLFLGILRDVFQKIHKSLPNLEITEWVPVPNHPNHPPLDYQELLGQESMGESTITIGKLRLKLDLRQLLDGYESVESRRKSQKRDNDLDDRTAYEDMRDIAKLAVSRPIINKAEANAMSENPQFTNNLQGANIANLANQVKDNASQQASNFNQTSGANISEILQLIGNLRQTAAQFPPDIRDDITIDIDDVEVEIQKPEKERNLPKLKKRLVALLTAATLVAAPIAGMTDFANNIMEIGNKLNIVLPLPFSK
ncbi:MAG: leucine-rich repeat domain-containing protein, partial [Nostoc sp.]|uniref:leucine-rich repeat domain-containing protein n=1 Tax=Nostoc sp. TaxID=1180 RepID=UPI002FF2C251